MPTHRTDVDVVVVGGGPAGATVACLLAMRSHRVLLVHGGRPRAYGTATLFTGVRGVANELGLLTALDAAAARRCDGLEVTDPGGRTRRATFADRGPYPFAHHIDDGALVDLLRARAVEMGATVLRSPVREIVRSRRPGGRVTGVRHGATAAATTTARMVVDASGPDRVVAARAAAPGATSGPTRLVVRIGLRDMRLPGRSAPLRVECPDTGGSTWLWVTPGPGDRGELAWSAPAVPPGPGPGLWTPKGLGRLLGGSLAGARPDGRPVLRRYRTHGGAAAHGPGWVAVGAAESSSDPPLGGGASLAMITAAPAAEAMHQVLSGRAEEHATMARYLTGVRDLTTDVRAFARACGAASVAEQDVDRDGAGQPAAGLDVLLCGTVVLRRPPAGAVGSGRTPGDAATLGTAPDVL